LQEIVKGAPVNPYWQSKVNMLDTRIGESVVEQMTKRWQAETNTTERQSSCTRCCRLHGQTKKFKLSL